MKTNTKRDPIYTAQGAAAQHINAEQELRRSVMSCMLWEKEFYEDGVTIADRIASLIPQIFGATGTKVAEIAIEARTKMKLRHAPLLIAREMARYCGASVSYTLENIIQRPDELTEFLSLYWMNGRSPLSAQVKKGLAKAFVKFNEYELAKYNRDGKVKLRDVLFLCHAKPKNKDQADMFKRLIDGKLAVPDTWETNLSAGEGKKETFTRLIAERKLGALALLRNLRNMQQVGVAKSIIVGALAEMKTDRVLPFRFLTAAKHAPSLEEAIEGAFFRCVESQRKLPGKTVLIVDVSGSMYGSALSKYSEMDRANVACSLAVLARELCEDIAIYATAGDDRKIRHQTKLVPSRRGFALSDVIYGMCSPLGGGGIFLKQVMDFVGALENKTADRVIVITDEQDCDVDRSPLKANTWGKRNYLINVASNKNGIGYGKWTHIDGFSEAVLDWIVEYEQTLAGLIKQINQLLTEHT